MDTKQLYKLLNKKVVAATSICPIGFIYDENGNRILARTEEGGIYKHETVYVVRVEPLFPYLIVRKNLPNIRDDPHIVLDKVNNNAPTNS